jgi:hypothetical protein
MSRAIWSRERENSRWKVRKSKGAKRLMTDWTMYPAKQAPRVA